MVLGLTRQRLIGALFGPEGQLEQWSVRGDMGWGFCTGKKAENTDN